MKDSKEKDSKEATIVLTFVAVLLTMSGPVLGQTTTIFSVAPGGRSGLGSEFIFSSGPIPVAGGAAMGLVLNDDIDGFSAATSLSLARLRFSVDPESTGDPLKPSISGLPFNVTDEALVDPRELAGDIFLMSEAATRSGIVAGPPSLLEFNNSQAVDESVFGLIPGNGGSEDDVNGGGRVQANLLDGSAIVPALYFTLSAASPSISATPGSSGADIFFDPTPDLATGFGGDESLFASAANLGLDLADDIDALMLFDDDLDRVFSPGDQVLFSLARGSASFSDVTSPLFGRNPADVFTVTFGVLRGPLASPTLFADAALHGLLASGPDNLNMLMIPEPTSLLLLASGGLMLARRRRH